MCRQVTQYGTYTFLAAAIILLLSYVIEKGVNELDNMLVPCQHGTTFSQGKCRCDGTPFRGTYCSDCICDPGYCVIGGTTPFRSSDYGCRCPTGTKRFGFLCDQCNTIDNETCKGNCSAEYFGTRCEKRCFADLSYYNNNTICDTLRENGGKCDVCHGHGTCNNGECECDDNWFNDGLRKCVNTCPSTDGTICSGHGVCKLFGGTPGCLCEIGYSGSGCEIECPGMSTVGIPCNDNGRCNPDFDTKTATCDCQDKFRGVDCGIECPGDIIACNGHGTCDDVGNCTCDTNLAWTLPSCKCSDEFTCNRNGQCNSEEKCECFGNFGGDHCIECRANYFGDNCDLFCNPYVTCNGHGTCLVENNAIKCTCNLHTSRVINVGGASNLYTSYYSESSNCGECEEGYFPKEAVVAQYGMPAEFQVPCEYECEPSTCNFDAGVCNPQYGAPNTPLCDCVNPNVDPLSMCTECKDGWFPNDKCNKFCVASGILPPECDGTKDCVTCNGHGECNLDGQCVCSGGYTGDQCQILCTSANGLTCGGHGTCESNDIQLLMEHEFRKEGNVALFSCTCDPQDPVGADARIDWDEKLEEGLVNGTLDPLPDPEYFGETCDYHCLRPPWKDSGECNGLGNCSVMTIRTPTGGFVSCNKDSDCTGSTTITQMLSIDPFWSNKKGPFCHREDDIHGCDKSTDDCYEILLKQRPRKMRNEECVEGSDIITAHGPPSLVLSWSECKAYSDATAGLVWSGNTSWVVPPQGCYASPNQWGDDLVYFNTFASGVDCSADKYCIQLSCYDAIENEDWHSYCQNLEDKLQPPLFKDCNSVEPFCPAKTIPTGCKVMVELTDGVDVSAKLNRTYEYDKRQYPFLITAEDYRTPHASLEHDAAEQNFNFFINKWFTHTDYKLDTSFCSAHSNRYPVIDYARENKQYLCNGVITNDKNCSGFFEESAGTFYKPFEVVCPNSETEFRTYEEALQAREANCKVVEKIFNNNTADTDGKVDIDLVCKIIDNKFPTCKPATACDFNPCSPNHVCSSDGLMATCTTSGQLNSTCLSGAFVDRPTFDSYRCEITFTDNDDCPTDVSFNTNYPKYCKDNNPVVSYVESMGNSQNVSISMDKYIRFEFKATDAVLTGTRLEFEDAITIYIRQGQIQLNEVSSLQACPVTNINCHDDWAYTPDEWYTLELEINGGSVTMTRKDTGKTITKNLLSSNPITSVATEPGQSIVQYRYISVEKDIPSPHSCTYAACKLDVNYREICSDIVRNIQYPLTLLPKHDILDTCSTLHISSRVVNTFSYEINEDIYKLLDWDLYCGFYDALTTSNITAQYTDLETYPQCREFVDPMDGNKTCIVNALDHDWVQGCSDIDIALIPDAIEKACPNTCYNHLLSLDRDFCPERDEIFSANKVVKDTCSTDWYDYCLKDSKGTLDGKCSAVECNCDTEKYEGISGQSCEIHCPVGFDGSACAEASGMGTCRYTQLQKETLENTVADEDGNRQAFQPQFALEGECECHLSEGTRNCDIECRDCNNNTYGSLYIEVTSGMPDLSMSLEECEAYLTVISATSMSSIDNPAAPNGCYSAASGALLYYNSNGGDCETNRPCIQKSNARGQIGICDTTRGACQCLPPFTAVNFYNETDWRGKVIEKNEREYNDGDLTGKELYRIRQMQGKESYIRNALQTLTIPNPRIEFTTSGTDHFVYNGQNDPDINLCQFYPYVIYHDHNEDMRIVKGEDCDNKGCSDGKWITLPANFEKDFIPTEDESHTFYKTGTYYYMSTVAPDMVGKIIVSTCIGTPVYDGSEPWEKIHERFLNKPGDFWCYDRQCTGGDVNKLGSLDESSSRYNYDCNSICPGFDNVTHLSCSKRGRCGVTGQCVCDTASVITGTDDAGFKQIIQIQPGVELVNTDLTITTLDRTGYRGDDCSIICPGFDEDTQDMTTICNGHGTCDLGGGCACEVGYIGDECQFKCPSSDGTSLCNGHGTCELAEVNILLDTYDDVSTDCSMFADVPQCEGYAILNDLSIIDIAGIREVGQNEACETIENIQCEKWGTQQELTYTYNGEIIDPSKPLGCIVNINTNVIEFNKPGTLANDVKCGGDYNCLCQKTKPEIMYCKEDGDYLIIHEMGGSQYKNDNGRWVVTSYGDDIGYKSTPGEGLYPLTKMECARHSCDTNNDCIAGYETRFSIDEFISSSQIYGGKPCNGEHACQVLVDNDPDALGYYGVEGYTAAPFTEAGCGTDCGNKGSCEAACSADSSCDGWAAYYRKSGQRENCMKQVCENTIVGQMCFPTYGRWDTCPWEIEEHFTYGAAGGCSLRDYTNSYKKGTEFYYGNQNQMAIQVRGGDTAQRFDGSKLTQAECQTYGSANSYSWLGALSDSAYTQGCYNPVGTTDLGYNTYTNTDTANVCGYLYNCVEYIANANARSAPIIKKERTSSSSWGSFSQLSTSTTYPSGCIKEGSNFKWIEEGTGDSSSTIARVEHDLYFETLKATCTTETDCLGIQEDPPGSNEWHKVTSSLSIITGTAGSFGPVPFFSDGYKCTNCGGGLLISRKNAEEDALAVCAGNTRSANGVAFSLKNQPGYDYYCCTSTDCRAWEEQNQYYQSYKLFDVVSGENTKRLVKNPANVCIKPEAAEIEAKSQAPALKSLRVANDLCTYLVTSGTCPTAPTREDCDRYNGGYAMLTGDATEPNGCYMSNGQYNWKEYNQYSPDCSVQYPCVCKSDTYLDKNTNRCKSIDKEPIINVRLYIDQGKTYEITKDIDCQVNSATKITCAQCNCFSNYVYGKWSGFECETCAKGYGKSQCRETCPGYDGETMKSMCGGGGKCLYGSQISGLFRVFQEANCVCGQDGEYEARKQTRDIVAVYPSQEAVRTDYFYSEMMTDGNEYATYDAAKDVCSRYNDLSMASIGGYCYGVFIQNKPDSGDPDIYEIAMGIVGSLFISYYKYYEKTLIGASTIQYTIKQKELTQSILGLGEYKPCKEELELVSSGIDTCNHFSTTIGSCDECQDGWTGKNCRVKCNKCLFQGICEGAPSKEEESLCTCPAGSGLWGHQCCPSGFMVPNIINWNSLTTEKIGQIKLVSEYDGFSTNELDASFHCKKCPGVVDSDWLSPAASHKVCGGESRGRCVARDNRLECLCKTNPESGSPWLGRACSCHDSISTAYNPDASKQETTDYGCLIPTQGTGQCPDPSPTNMGKYYFVPPLWYYMHYYTVTTSGGGLYMSIGSGSIGNGNRYIGFSSSDSSYEKMNQWSHAYDKKASLDTTYVLAHETEVNPLHSPFAGGIAGEIYVTSTGFQGYTGQGPCDTNIPVEVTSGSPDQSVSISECQNYATSIGYTYGGNPNDGNVMGCFVQHGTTTVYYNEKSTTTNCEDILESRCIQIQATNCKGTLVCHDRAGVGLGKEGYNVDRVSPSLRFCVEEQDSKIGCDPLLVTNPSIWGSMNTQFHNSLCINLGISTDPQFCNANDIGYKIVSTNGYWDGSTFATARVGYYVPYTQDGNGDLVIHRQDFPCPAGKYGVDAIYDQYENARMCVFCRHNEYQDEVGQTSCKDCPSNKGHASLGQTTAAACTSCPEGKVFNFAATPTAWTHYCEDCERGKYAVNNGCTNCPSGRYGGQGSYDSCVSCAGGRYSDAGASYSSDCKYCNSGNVNYLMGDASTAYSDYNLLTTGSPDGNVNADRCKGYAEAEVTSVAWTNGGTVSELTRPGGCFKHGSTVYYNSYFTDFQCSTTYQCVSNPDTYNKGYCSQCSGGKYRRSSDQPCRRCEGGKYSMAGGATYSYGQSGCTNCGCGRYGSTAGNSHSQYSWGQACTGCGNGKYQNQGGQTACKTCPSGKYGCSGCSAGWYRI